MAYDYDFQNFQSTVDYQKVMDMLTKQILSGDSKEKRKAAEALAKVVNAASTQDNNKLKAILAQEAARQAVEDAAKKEQQTLAEKEQARLDKQEEEKAKQIAADARDKMLGKSAMVSGGLAAAAGLTDIASGVIADRANAKATDDERYARILASIKTPGYNQTAQNIYGTSPMDMVANSLAEGKAGEAQVKRAKAATTANALKRAADILRVWQGINNATSFAKSGTGAGTLLAAKGLATIGTK